MRWYEVRISLAKSGNTTVRVQANSSSQANQMVRTQHGSQLRGILSCRPA